MNGIQTRKASIKETGEELSREEWERFDAAVAEVRAERSVAAPNLTGDGVSLPPPAKTGSE